MFNKENIKFIDLTVADRLLKLKPPDEVVHKRKIVNKIALNDSILMLLSIIDHNRKVISRTLMQREIFLFYEEVLKSMGLSQGAIEAGFFPYKYGPYSIDVNLALSTLIFSGEITVQNYYEDPEGNRTRKFLTVFSTDVDFNKVATKYEEVIIGIGYTMRAFQNIVRDRKQAWDQSKANGINKLLLSKGFRDWYSNRSLKDVYPNINFGKITEDYRPRVVIK